jgi:hypothetical protein
MTLLNADPAPVPIQGDARGLRVRLKRPLLLLAGVMLVVLGLWGLVLRAVDATPYALALDDLRIPSTWRLGASTRHEAILMGTPIHRYYLVAGEAEDIFPNVRAVVSAAGFDIDEARADGCALLRTGGPKDCYLAARREGVYLWIVVYHRGDVVWDTLLPSPLGAPDSSVIRIGSGPRY